MNVERLNQLADHIERLEHAPTGVCAAPDNIPFGDTPDAFNMSNWVSESTCGTAGCIAGHAGCLFRDEQSRMRTGIMTDARRLLELTPREGSLLFIPGTLGTMDQITPAMAAQVLRLVAGGMEILDAWKATLPSHLGLRPDIDI